MKSPCWDPTAALPVSVLFGIQVTHCCFGRGKPRGRLHINRLTMVAYDKLITPHTKTCHKVNGLGIFHLYIIMYLLLIICT